MSLLLPLGPGGSPAPLYPSLCQPYLKMVSSTVAPHKMAPVREMGCRKWHHAPSTSSPAAVWFGEPPWKAAKLLVRLCWLWGAYCAADAAAVLPLSSALISGFAAMLHSLVGAPASGWGNPGAQTGRAQKPPPKMLLVPGGGEGQGRGQVRRRSSERERGERKRKEWEAEHPRHVQS